jgi:hypothetical protein
MAEYRGWMYGGWKKGGAQTKEWMKKTQEFIDHAFFIKQWWSEVSIQQM